MTDGKLFHQRITRGLAWLPRGQMVVEEWKQTFDDYTLVICWRSIAGRIGVVVVAESWWK